MIGRIHLKIKPTKIYTYEDPNESTPFCIGIDIFDNLM
jgi:hypothetical protein